MSYQPVSYDEFMQLIGYTPKDYQREGVEWCKKRENSNQEHRGGILADEMGLGKTITMISLMLAQYEKRTLIVLPLALLNQWYDVIHNTLNYRAPMYHGVEKKTVHQGTFRELSICVDNIRRNGFRMLVSE